MTEIILGIGIFLCLLLSNFFSSSEMGYSSCNEIRLENEAGEEGKNSKKARNALYIIKHFDDALSTILIGNNLVNIASSSMVAVLMLLITGTDDLTWAGTAAVTVLVIIFGETIPKITAKKKANTIALNNAGIIRTLMVILFPVVWLVVKLVNLLTSGIREENDTDEDESVEELQSIIETAEDEGILDKDRTELLHNAIDFGEKSASEAMTARVDMDAIDIEDSPEEILKTVEKTAYSRLPVYEGSVDNIIGVIHLNHFLKAVTGEGKVDIRSVLMPASYVYKTTKLPDVLKQLRKAKQHLAVVTDEYGGTLGVITMEDVLEEIVGDIWDESDEVEEEAVERAQDEFEVDGYMNIDDFLELVKTEKTGAGFESQTVGGWVIEQLGHYPEKDEEFTFGDLCIKVLEAGDRRVEKVLVRKTAAEA